MQLEIIYMQATMMAKTLWLDQLKIHMDSNRSNLTLVYWGGGSPAVQWGCPQVNIVNNNEKRKCMLYTYIHFIIFIFG